MDLLQARAYIVVLTRLISDTTQLALLIDERDEVLENLEIAETKYIQSFRLSTPDPSIADWEPPVAPHADPGNSMRPEISRPKPLSSATVSASSVFHDLCLDIDRNGDGGAGVGILHSARHRYHPHPM